MILCSFSGGGSRGLASCPSWLRSELKGDPVVSSRYDARDARRVMYALWAMAAVFVLLLFVG